MRWRVLCVYLCLLSLLSHAQILDSSSSAAVSTDDLSDCEHKIKAQVQAPRCLSMEDEEMTLLAIKLTNCQYQARGARPVSCAIVKPIGKIHCSEKLDFSFSKLIITSLLELLERCFVLTEAKRRQEVNELILFLSQEAHKRTTAQEDLFETTSIHSSMTHLRDLQGDRRRISGKVQRDIQNIRRISTKTQKAFVDFELKSEVALSRLHDVVRSTSQAGDRADADMPQTFSSGRTRKTKSYLFMRGDLESKAEWVYSILCACLFLLMLETLLVNNAMFIVATVLLFSGRALVIRGQNRERAAEHFVTELFLSGAIFILVKTISSYIDTRRYVTAHSTVSNRHANI